MAAHYIRILGESKDSTESAPDVLTNNRAFWWRGNDLKIDLALTDNGVFLLRSDVTNITVVVKELDAASTDAPLMTKTLTQSDCDAAFTGASWSAGTSALVAAEWTDLEAALTAGEYFLIVEHEDASGKKNTYLKTKIEIKEDAHENASIPTPPTPVDEYYTKIESDGKYETITDADTHKADTANPHSVTATQVGLGNSDNTSDINKPVSTAQQTAIDLIAPSTIAGPVWPDPAPLGIVTNLAQKRISKYEEGDWRDLAAWPSDGFLQTTVGAGAYLAFSIHELGQYGSGQKTFRARRDNDDDEEDFYGGEYGSTRFFDWAGSNAVYLTRLYDQVAGVKFLTQPNETRQYKIADSGAIIDWVAHSGGSGADVYLNNSGLADADNLSAFYSYSSRTAAAIDTQSANVWTLGDANNSEVIGHHSTSGYLTNETIAFDVRQSDTGTERVGATGYARAADTTVLEAAIFTGTGMTFYQDDSAVTLDENNNSIPASEDYAPSSYTIEDQLTIGAQRIGGSPQNGEDITLDAIVFYKTDEDANQTAIHDALSSALTNQFRVMTFNVRDFNGTTTADAQYVAMENFVERYQPDVLSLQEIHTDSVDLIVGDFATDNGYDYYYYGQKETYGIVMLSKFPITYSELVDSPDGTAFDRPARYIEFDFHGRPFGVYGIHSSTWCVSDPCLAASPSNETKRVTELEIIGLHKTDRLAANSRLEFMIMGDHNGDSAVLTHAASQASYGGAPSTITFPITVETGSGATEGYPETQLAAYGMTAINSQNIDSNDSTMWVTTPNSLITFEVHLDEISHSSGLTLVGHEIGDSEATQTGGITKYGSALTSTDGRDASDHKPVIADFSF